LEGADAGGASGHEVDEVHREEAEGEGKNVKRMSLHLAAPLQRSLHNIYF
jgi:hypothetical protein